MTRTWRLNESLTIALSVVGLLVVVLGLVYFSQYMIERDALSPSADPAALREVREIDKLSAEIRQIRSDTGGSLFWLKLVGVLVTVGRSGGRLPRRRRAVRRGSDSSSRTAGRSTSSTSRWWSSCPRGASCSARRPP